MLIEQSRGGIPKESIALGTAAGQKYVESASSFWSLGSCFSKLAYSTDNFAVANADKQNVRSGNIENFDKTSAVAKTFVIVKGAPVSGLAVFSSFLFFSPARESNYIYKLPINRPGRPHININMRPLGRLIGSLCI